MSNVGNEVIVQPGEFSLNGKVSEYYEHCDSNSHDHNNADYEDANLRGIEYNFGRDLKPCPHLFKDYIIRNVPVYPEPKETQPCNLCKDKGKENEKLRLMFLHNCNNKNNLEYISKFN